MSKFAVLVVGAAGAGKTTFCTTIAEHLKILRQNCNILNLDPASIRNAYISTADITEKFNVQDVMERMKLGPNGALIKCLNLMLEESEWLTNQLDGYAVEFLLID